MHYHLWGITRPQTGMMVITGNILILMLAYLRMFHLHDSEKMASFKKRKGSWATRYWGPFSSSSIIRRVQIWTHTAHVLPPTVTQERSLAWELSCGGAQEPSRHWDSAMMASGLHAISSRVAGPLCNYVRSAPFFFKLVHSLPKNPVHYHVCFHLKYSESIQCK